MPARPEPSRRRLAGRGIVAALAILAAMPAYLALSPPWRPAAVRVACALLVAGGCVRALRWLRAAAGPRPVSPLDAPPAAPPALAVDARFVGLRDDLLSSTRSRRYFDVILWPRLRDLAGRDLPRPPERPGILRRRGPSLRAIEGLVAEVERGA
jgi:hypothetical protein